jgi:hypothetical protein
VINTNINYKKLFDGVGQREVFFFLSTLVTNKGEHSVFSQRKQILTG